MLIVLLGSPRPMSPRPVSQVTPTALFENHSAGWPAEVTSIAPTIGRSAEVSRNGGDPKIYLPPSVPLPEDCRMVTTWAWLGSSSFEKPRTPKDRKITHLLRQKWTKYPQDREGSGRSLTKKKISRPDFRLVNPPHDFF
jgi:hypothetical protein